MDLASILFGAISGVLAAVIAQLLVRDKEARRGIYVAVLVASFLVLKFGFDQTLAPRVRVWQANREIRELPLYRDLAADDPVAYAKVEAVIAESVKNNDKKDAIAAKIAPVISATVPKYVGKASDDAVIGFVGTISTELTKLHGTNPEACYAFLFPGEKIGAPADMSEEEQQKLLAAMGMVIHTSVHSPQPLPDAAKAQELLSPIQQRLAQDFGSDLQLMARKPTNAHERERVCAIVDSIYAKILVLPKTDASLVLRNMLGGQ